jgi:hypothetical protein
MISTGDTVRDPRADPLLGFMVRLAAPSLAVAAGLAVG